MRTLVVGSSRAFESTVVSCLKGCADIEIIGIASEGREGVKLARLLSPDLVITQFDMPDMTGPALTRALKSNKIAPPAVIVVSLTDAPYRTQLSYQAGADVHLDKSALGQLVPMVQRLIEQEGYGAPDQRKHLAWQSTVR